MITTKEEWIAEATECFRESELCIPGEGAYLLACGLAASRYAQRREALDLVERVHERDANEAYLNGTQHGPRTSRTAAFGSESVCREADAAEGRVL